MQMYLIASAITIKIIFIFDMFNTSGRVNSKICINYTGKVTGNTLNSKRLADQFNT